MQITLTCDLLLTVFIVTLYNKLMNNLKWTLLYLFAAKEFKFEIMRMTAAWIKSNLSETNELQFTTQLEFTVDWKLIKWIMKDIENFHDKVKHH